MPLDILSNSTTLLKISDIRTDGGTQPRAGLTSQIIIEYSEAISGPNDWPFPPLVVYFDGSSYWLADGFHRLAAAKMYADREKLAYSVVADVRQGTQRDAVLYSVGANADHGLRRTSEDKRRSVLRLLEDSEWSQWSNREIARRCRVDEKTVRSLRDTVSAENPQIERKVERNGTVYTQNTAKIGAAKPTASVDDLTRHIGSWLSQQIGKPIDLLTSAAVRSHSTRHQLELFLGRRDVTFKRDDLETAIAQVANNVVQTGAANTELRGPMPTMTHKDVEDLKARQAAPPTDNTSLSVEPQTPMSKSLSLNLVGNAERLAAVRKVIASQPEAAETILDDLKEGRRGWYHDAILCYCDDTTPEEWKRIAAQAATPSPLNGRSGDDLIKQYETDGWKVNRTDDGWQAIHHHDQVATPKCGNVAELLDALDDGNFAEEFYFLDDGVEPLSAIVARFRRNLDTASHYLSLAEEGMAQIRKRHDASAVDMGLRTTRKWLDQTIGGGEVIAKYTANK